MAKRGKRSKKIKKSKNKFKNKQSDMTVVKDKALIAIYGNMRIDGKEHKNIPNSAELKGMFYSEPIYKMNKQLGDAALFESGKTSILFEVYEIDNEDIDRFDINMGYDSEWENDDSTQNYNYYLRRIIETPFGKAFVYFYNGTNYEVNEKAVISSGDWIDYLKEDDMKTQLKNIKT